MTDKDVEPSVWDDAKFQEVADRHGWSMGDLCAEAGLARDYLTKIPGTGRNIGSIMLLAQAGGVGVGELLGLESAGPTTQELARLGLVANVAAHLFVALGSGYPPAVDINEIVKAVLDAVKRSQPKETRSMPGEAPKTSGEGDAPRTSRTSHRRSSGR